MAGHDPGQSRRQSQVAGTQLGALLILWQVPERTLNLISEVPARREAVRRQLPWSAGCRAAHR
jgi:hypothetical protein